jgi:DNA-binding transcriptional ArsR family regulator
VASLLWHTLVGTRGGPKRAEILSLLERRPYNAHEISRLLGVDYKTARHHLKVLLQCGLIVGEAGPYTTLYSWSPAMRADAAEWARVWAIVSPTDGAKTAFARARAARANRLGPESHGA